VVAPFGWAACACWCSRWCVRLVVCALLVSPIESNVPPPSCLLRRADVDWSRVESTSPHPWEYRPSEPRTATAVHRPPVGATCRCRTCAASRAARAPTPSLEPTPTGEVGDRLFDALRRPQRPGCSNAAGALAAAPAAFLQQDKLFAAAAAAEAGGAGPSQLQALGRGVCRALLLHQQEAAKYPALGPRCPLMARKFADETVKVGARLGERGWPCASADRDRWGRMWTASGRRVPLRLA
jgi:hypothetical protein